MSIQKLTSRFIYKCAIVCALLMFSLFNKSFAQDISINAYVDSSQILIGDQIFMHMELTVPNGASVMLPNYVDTVMEGIEVIENIPIDSQVVDNKLVLTKKVLITSFDSGAYMIPIGPIVLNSVDTFLGKPVFLSVNTMEIDTAKGIVDIKLPYSAPITFKEILPWLAWGGGILLVIGALLFYYFKYMKKNKEEETYEYIPKDPPHIIAYRELDKLKNEKLWQSGKIKLYYSRLTEILRTYVEYHFELPALENTTHEIITNFKESKYLEQDKLMKLKSLLELADLVKFAKHNPVPEENESSYNEVYDFIRDTKMIMIHSLEPSKDNEGTN